MAPNRRTDDELDGDREAHRIALTLGADLRHTRKRRQMTQAQLGAKIGCSHAWIGRLERGDGADASLQTWIRLGKAIDRPFAAGFSRDVAAGPVDAGHLDAQELILRLARSHGRLGLFELPTRSHDPSRSTDVGIRADATRTLILVEIWNRLDDLGRAARDSDRKLAEAADIARFRQPAYRVAACWLFVDTAANRALVRRYPEILRSRFPGSSSEWVRALADGAPPPAAVGICWIDPRSGRLSALRLRR